MLTKDEEARLLADHDARHWDEIDEEFLRRFAGIREKLDEWYMNLPGPMRRAMLKAIFDRGLSEEETVVFTDGFMHGYLMREG